ncbi:conjugal transfer protein TrbL family protein [Dactylosporangium sp. CS-047395]|uniref:conjugal transfer protein TrbL family protein n=1 Tax=Dactylosporangium sp. CS-047395 TaxID=3239936 RepID=UPI003D934B58
MGDWFADQVIGHVTKWTAELVIGALNMLWDLLSATAFVSPDVTKLPQVTAFAATSLGVVNTCYVLAFLWAGITVMGRGTIQATAEPGEQLPRLVLGLIGANFAVPLCSALIDLANAFTAALTSQDITSPGSMQLLRATTVSIVASQNGDNPTGFLLVLTGLLVAVLTGTLLVQWIVRIGVLVVAVGIAPIALALHGTAQTEGAAKLWWRTMLGTLGIVVVQAFALHVTLRVFLSPDSNLAVLGVPMPNGEPSALLNLLIVVCLLWGIVKIPGLMRRYVTQSRPGALGTVLRVVVVQQLSKGISRALGGPRRAVRGAGRAAGGGGGAGAGGSDRPWPVRPAGGAPGARRAAGRGAAGRSGSAAPSGADQGRPATSGSAGRARSVPPPRQIWPRSYTRAELASGVDLYTRAMKARSARPPAAKPRA